MDLSFGVIFKAFVLVLLGFATEIICSPNTECGKLDNKNKTPWTVGIYLEKEQGHLELICLGTVLKNHYVVTASQCVCDTLSKEVRKETIYVSKDIQTVLGKTSSMLEIKPKNVIHPKEYQGFLLSPVGDLAVLKVEGPHGHFGNSICVDWSDLHKLLQGNKNGILSVWNNRITTIDSSLVDEDLCTSLTSEVFVNMLSSDKNCFQTSVSDIGHQSIGSGIYYQNPTDGRWYIEGVVSGSEVAKDGVYLAATSVRRYLAWLSRTSLV